MNTWQPLGKPVTYTMYLLRCSALICHHCVVTFAMHVGAKYPLCAVLQNQAGWRLCVSVLDLKCSGVTGLRAMPTRLPDYPGFGATSSKAFSPSVGCSFLPGRDVSKPCRIRLAYTPFQYPSGKTHRKPWAASPAPLAPQREG